MPGSTPASASDTHELEAELTAVRDALARARTALSEASAAERILTARFGAKSVEELDTFPSIEEPTILTTGHALRRVRSDSVLIGLAGAGVALAAVIVTLLVLLAFRPKDAPAAVVAPIPPPSVTVPPAAEPAPDEPAPPTESTARAPAAPAATSAAAFKAADDCSSRTYVDARGVKHYKTHCLGF